MRFEPPELGATDAKGFRTFSLYTRGAETLRVSIHIERFRKDLLSTNTNLATYSSAEQEGLKTAATILTGKHDAPFKGDERAALAVLQELSSRFAASDIEQYFPFLATLALKDYCQILFL